MNSVIAFSALLVSAVAFMIVFMMIMSFNAALLHLLP
jgi:hypothetical protein